MKKETDSAYLEMAYSLAERGRGWTHPNPMVGAVLVKNGHIIGWGYHKGPGHPHAETDALERAGREAEGATIYLTLEPCVHWGNTPPCANALIDSRIRRAVISDYDPNPLVNRKGVRKIQEAGIDVTTGLLQSKNRRLNEAYIKYITQKVPFVTIKAAMSLDGRIATRSGDSKWISSPAAREYIHLLRGENAAIMIGINTVLKDDPLLTVRHPSWSGKKIIRIIIDSRLRFPLEAAMLSTLEEGEIRIFTHHSAPNEKEDKLRARGIAVIRIQSDESAVDLAQVLTRLGEDGISTLLAEGGGGILTGLIENNLADRYIFTITPTLIGGVSAPTFFLGRGAARMKDAIRLSPSRSFRIDEDLIVEGYF